MSLNLFNSLVQPKVLVQHKTFMYQIHDTEHTQSSSVATHSYVVSVLLDCMFLEDSNLAYQSNKLISQFINLPPHYSKLSPAIF